MPRFRLFIAGDSLRSRRAIANLHAACRDLLGEEADIEVIDVLDQPDLADRDQILATPTVIRLEPGPIRRVIGDLSDHPALLDALELAPERDIDGDKS